MDPIKIVTRVSLLASILITAVPHLINMIRERRQHAPRPPHAMAVEEMIERARHKLSMDVVGFLNFAFCGPQNSGKSSLINSLRELPDVGPEAAEQYDEFLSATTGEGETTEETRHYSYPVGNEFEFVRFWDHPGCGTQNHPTANYFDDNVLYAYDCVLMVTTGGLGEYERSIIEAARRHGTDVVIVVNKAEQQVEARRRRRPHNAGPFDEDARKMLIQEIINEAKQRINNALDHIQQVRVPVFVVSAWKWSEYQNTGDREDQDMSMEIVPLFKHVINVALARRAP